MAIYQYQRLYKAFKISSSSPWLDWVRKHNGFLIVLTLICGLAGSALLILIISWKPFTLILLFTMILIAVLYVIPIRGFVLRELPGLKSVLVASVWTGFIIAFPLMNEHRPLQLHAQELLAFFCYFFALTIPFDIRDLKYDKPHQRTIPQLLGTSFSKVISILLLGVFILNIAKINNEMRYNELFYTGTIMAGTLILFTNNRRDEWYFALIDGSMILVGMAFL